MNMHSFVPAYAGVGQSKRATYALCHVKYVLGKYVKATVRAATALHERNGPSVRTTSLLQA